MKNEAIQLLENAINSYDYPAVCYNFKEGKEFVYGSIKEVEQEIRKGLIADDPEEIFNALSNIMYWGFYRQGRRDYKVSSFRKLDKNALKGINQKFLAIHGAGLKEIAALKIPQFTKISFVSKVRMFLDPANYAVLDFKIAKLKEAPVNNPIKKLKLYSTSIPITAANLQVYEEWFYYVVVLLMPVLLVHAQ